ncbi:hypothetical protein GH733_003211 [Mirounga leonina]|nr:hypothetical protein GH733_003211 [Mirounga leonina]
MDTLGVGTQKAMPLPRGAIHGLLGGSDDVDSGQESLHDAEVVMDDLGQRGQAVGGAGGIADNLESVVILLMVHTHNEHGGIGRGSRDDDPLGPALQVSPSFLHGGEDPSGLHNILSTSITPFDVGGISLLEDGDGLSIDDKLPVLSLDCAVEFAMGGIILEHVDHVVEANEGVTDGNNIHFARVKSSPGDQVPNTAKFVHCDLHHRVSGMWLALHQKMRLSVEGGGAESRYPCLGGSRLHRLCRSTMLEGIRDIEVLHGQHVLQGLHGGIQGFPNLEKHSTSTKTLLPRNTFDPSKSLCPLYFFHVKPTGGGQDKDDHSHYTDVKSKARELAGVCNINI